MHPVVTPEEMGEADRRAIASGTPDERLVERSGRAAAWGARRLLGGCYGRRVVVVCGKGNNGADGFVAARTLRAWGTAAAVFRIDEGLDRAACARELARADVFVDAMFGTGFRGALEGDAAWVAQAAAAARHAIAVDIPSGVDGRTGAVAGRAVRADLTVCLAALKPGLLLEPGRSHAGIVTVADIGVEVGTPLLGVPDASDLVLPSRAVQDHKWSAGLMVVAGSAGMVGAALLVARAALRVGAGMVVAGLPGDAAHRAAGSEVVTQSLPATPEGGLDIDAARWVLRDLSRFRALALGPGLGTDDRTAAAVGRLVAECPHPLVVDADALNALAVDPAPLAIRNAAGLPRAVLTPHEGEYARLAGEAVAADRVAAARALAARTGCVVLLKGPGSVVADTDGRATINPTDSAALATPGTGDVLAGIVGALLARGVAPFEAAMTAAYVQGVAAREARTGESLVASDLIEALPRTLERLRHPTGRNGCPPAPP